VTEPNKWFPLPSDYDSLTKNGQKEARLAVLHDQSTPEKLVTAWSFFRNVYLKPQGESFYKGGFMESPPFHSQLINDLGRYARNVLAAPRGFSKSTVVGKEVPLFLSLTRPFFTITLCLPTDTQVESRFDDIMYQFTNNPLILEDFGEQKSQRGNAIWNHHHLHLSNGAILQGISVKGRKRGMRPRLFILDDPEFDPESRTTEARQVLLEQFETILFRQIIPMLEYGSAIFWIGTVLNRRCFLYHAIYDDDPRFAFWNRRILAGEEISPKNPTERVALWDEKWPLELLDARRAEIGSAAYAAEILNNPISDTERLLVVDSTFNEYSVPTLCTVPENPFIETAETIWHERVKSPDGQASLPQEVKKPFKELITPLFRIATVDFASGLTAMNDFSCIGIFGFDNNNCLWLLDMWMGRVKEAELLRQIFLISKKWQVRAIGVESASIQISFVDSVNEFVTQQAINQTEGWRPRIIPVKYPSGVSKSERIAGLDWRFQNGRIKYPRHLAQQFPFDALYLQTRDFTYDLALLRFDDAIDCVAMVQYTIKAPKMRSLDKQVPTNRTLEEQIKTGQPVVEGLPFLSGVSSSMITQPELTELLDQSIKKRYNNIRTKYTIRRPRIVR